MRDIEKLGVFYLGSVLDPAGDRPAGEPLLYDSRDLLTHAVSVGMTGSGKTGLGIALLEEAAIDGVPAIALDPKGDLGNLLLAFPDLAPSDFLPWIDPEEAAREGIAPEELAARTSEAWRSGLAESGQDGARVRRFRDATEAAIYTPGSSAGLGLSCMKSLAPPPAALAGDPEGIRERVGCTASGLLALLGIDADPLRSREHQLLAGLLDRAWREGKGLDLGDLVRGIRKPPFDRVGVVDLESFYPSRERSDLAMRVNGLLASPGFEAWLEGEPLDPARLLWSPGGKPRLSVVSIAHLSDAERMFFVTLLLGEIVAWMRAQPGTSSLRAVLYMDEVFGYLPPVANPPSKLPLLTLLKQARAYGLGVVLATQNPVDLDYKALSNAGTWFLGRLQTERDRDRVLDGLEGARASSGLGFDRSATERVLGGLGRRAFLLHDVHEDAPVPFRTRWVLSYLRGPLTRPQIRALTGSRGAAPAPPPPVRDAAAPTGVRSAAAGGGARPPLPPEIPERFAAFRGGESSCLRPHLLGVARLHYADSKAGVDRFENVGVLAPLGESAPPDPWEGGEAVEPEAVALVSEPPAGAAFAPLPPEAAQPRSYAAWSRSLAAFLFRTRPLELFRHAPLRLISSPGESEREFRLRAALASRERRDGEADRLRRQYAPKIAALRDRLRRAEQRVEREGAQYAQRKTETAISLGATVLGALLGRRGFSTGTLGRATTAARSIGRAAGERGDVARAAESVDDLRQRLEELEGEAAAAAASIEAPSPDRMELERVSVRPRKSDLEVVEVSLVWMP